MTQTTLRALSLETVANYRQAAEKTISAYRASGHRLLGLMNRNVERAARRGAERVAPKLAAALRRTSEQFAGAAAKGLDVLSARSEKMVGQGSAQISEGLGRVADLVEGIENRYLANGLQAAARFSLTGARAARSLSKTLATGADKLSAAAEGAARAPVKRAPAKRRTAKAAVAAAPVRRTRTATAKAPRARRQAA